MSGRFLSAPLFVAVVLLAQSNPLPRRFGQVALAVAALLLGTMTPYPPLLSGPRFGAAEDHLFDRHGICDERRYYFGSSGMINDIPKAKKPSHDAMKVGQTARRAATPLIVEGAIGFTGYGAGPAVHIVDYHALADPLLSRMPMVVRDTRYDRALFRMLGETDPQGWRIGHLLRNVPPGYLRTLVTGTNHLEDPRLRRFYDQLRVVTQAPLWSAHRIAEIVRMNLGHYDKLIDRTRPPQDEAVDWGEVIAVLPNVAEPYYQRGKQFFDARQSDRAIADLRRALELDPLHTDALILLGSIYMDKEETDQAIHCLNQVMAIDPREVTSYVYLGDLALRAKQHERAIALFKQAHHLDPRLWLACNNLGVAYVELGNNEEALAWLERARRLRPGSPEIHEDIGLVYLDMGNYKQAIVMIEKALALDPDSESLIMSAAAVHEGAGNIDRAMALLDRAVTLNPQDPECCFELGRMLRANGDESQALEYLRRAARLGYEPAQEALGANGHGW